MMQNFYFLLYYRSLKGKHAILILDFLTNKQQQQQQQQKKAKFFLPMIDFETIKVYCY